MSYNSIIKKYIKTKYRNTPVLNKIFINNYKKARYEFLQKIYQSQILENDQSYDHTTMNFTKILKNKKNIKKYEYYLISMYKKFEVNLTLKARYDNLKKKTNKNISYTGLLNFAILITKLRKLDKLHKFNFLLKLIDLVMIKKLSLTFFQKKKLIYLLNFEKKLFNQIND